MNGIRQCDEFCAFHIDHIDGCWLNWGSRKILQNIIIHIQLLRYLTYALNHCNPIVKKCSDIALRCALSPMGANIALFRYLYDVSFDRKMHVNEQSICNLYKIHSDSEQYATVGVLRDLINCRDGINVMDYLYY